MRVAGIDCGTNSLRLLVAEVAADGTLRDVVREMRIVRLGQDVDRTGRLAAEAIERTRVALSEYAATIAELGAERVRMVATSASRDAQNRDEFIAMVRDVLGRAPEIIGGDEEARLSFAGAAAGLAGLRAPILVADLGGGSTEVVLGKPGEPEPRAYSMDVGAVRMTERHLRDDPPAQEQIGAAIADIQAAIDVAHAHVPLTMAQTFVGVAGTVTTVAAVALGLDKYDSSRIHGASIPVDEVDRVVDLLLHSTHAERAAMTVIHPGRVDVIGAGALVLRTLMHRVGARVVLVSEHDILDGIALSALER